MVMLPFATSLSISKISQDNRMSIPILYESDNLIAIRKPPNIPHHDSENEEGILSYIRNLQSKDNFSYDGRIFGVHRLDRVTSGILILAKNRETAGILGKSFRGDSSNSVSKYYVALSSKKPKKKKQGWVKGDMVKSRRGAWKLTSKTNNPAVSRFFTAGLGNVDVSGWPLYHHLSSQSQQMEMKTLLPKTLILFKPHTGRTHQLRVAAKSVGLGILGDKMYGDSLQAQLFERTYLHAAGFHVHINGEEVAIWAPPSDWFNAENNKSSRCNDAENILKDLVAKHCDNQFILNAMLNYYEKSF